MCTIVGGDHVVGARARAGARAQLCARGRRPGPSGAGHCVRGPEPTSHTVRGLFHYRARLGSDSLTPLFTPPKENGFCYKTELFSLLAFGGVLKEAAPTLGEVRAREQGGARTLGEVRARQQGGARLAARTPLQLVAARWRGGATSRFGRTPLLHI